MARKRGTQKGRVHKQGKIWYVAYREDALDENGKIVRERRNKPICETKGVSKREAQRIANEQVLDRVNSQSQQPSSMQTVKQFVDNRFTPEVVKYMKHAGKKHYAYILGTHVVPAVGEKRLRDVTSDDVQALVGLKHDSGLSSQTVYHIKNAISAVFRHAKTKKAFVGDLPTEGVKMPEMVRKEGHSMDFGSALGLLVRLQAVSLKAYAMMLLALTTSMNVAELLGLRRKRVNLRSEPVMVGDRVLKGQTVAVRENYYRGEFGTVKKKARNRDLPLPVAVLQVLKQVMDESQFKGPDDLVFTTDNGTPLDEKNLMRRIIKPIAKELNMPWMGWHVCRHTHSTLAEELGMALSDRQAQMGHGDYRMTMLYTHSNLERRRQTLDLMADRLLGRKPDAAQSDTDQANLTLNDTKPTEQVSVNHSFDGRGGAI
jgi:integrase